MLLVLQPKTYVEGSSRDDGSNSSLYALGAFMVAATLLAATVTVLSDNSGTCSSSRRSIPIRCIVCTGLPVVPIPCSLLILFVDRFLPWPPSNSRGEPVHLQEPRILQGRVCRRGRRRPVSVLNKKRIE